MNDNLLRHFLAFIILIITVLSYFIGYYSALHGWLWSSLSLVLVYIITLKVIDHQ